MTLNQFPTIARLQTEGYVPVSGPTTLNTPVGGPVVMMNDKQKVVQVASDGSVEVAVFWPEHQIEDEESDGPTCGLEGCP